jgi:TatD DNase family protein
MPDLFYFDNPVPKSGLPLFDSHAHIHYPDFDIDRTQVIERAKQAGLTAIVCIGTHYEDSIKALKVAKDNPEYVYATVGNHPYYADQTSSKCIKDFKDLILCNPDLIVGIGETGLDYFKSPVDRKIQQDSFTEHCLLAKEFNLPVIIHLREFSDCFEDALRILKETDTKKAIFHCYTGDLESAKLIWAKGYKTSFGLIVNYPKNSDLRQIYNACPPEFKLHETDSPYLPPHDKRGQRNEPSFLADYF